MKVLQVNTVYGEGSTGKIAREIHDACTQQGIRCLTAHRCINKGAPAFEDSVEISSKWDSRLHGQLSRFTMFKGAGSFFKTLIFLKKIKAYSPDVIHLHNLHGSYVNLPLLFGYIKKHNIPVVWTLHDCWPFTAICSHFVIAECEKWESGCCDCPQKNRYSSALFDLSRQVWKAKRKWFSYMSDVTIVTPSHWLQGLVEKSFLKDYNITTIHNGIDLNIFKPTESDFRERYGLENKKIILGVAFDWGYSKGLDVFIKLAHRLDDNYRIVLVGTNDKIKESVPDNILCINRTADQQELASIYTAADVFFNPTREEVLGLVNLEALACGTPVVTFNTGGSPECIDETCGIVVNKASAKYAEKEILRVCDQNLFRSEDCINRAKAFDKTVRIEEYITLYKKIISK